MKLTIKETRNGKLEQATAALNCGQNILTSEENEWNISLTEKAVIAQHPYREFVLSAMPTGDTIDTTITISIKRDNWRRDNYVFVPSAAYNGNRFKSLPLAYPPISIGVVDDVENPEIIITDVPRLSKDGDSRFEVMVGDLSKPMMGYFSKEEKLGFFFAFEQQCIDGFDNSIRIEEYDEDAEFALVVPGLRSVMYRHMCSTLESDDCGVSLQAGQVVVIRFRIYELPCKSLTEYFSIFSDIRKKFDKPNVLENTIPFSKAFKAIESKYNTCNWMVRDQFYRSSNAGNDSICSQWQTGWVGGGMSTYPCFLAGGWLSKQRSYQTLDFLFREIMTETGLMYGIYCNGRPYGDSIDPEGDTNMLLLRKFTDAVYFLLKQLIVADKSAIEFPADWKEALHKSLLTLRDIFNDNGQFGQFIDVKTKRLVVRGTSSAATGIAALALGGNLYNDKSLLEAAFSAGEYYFKNYVANGISNGGPGEICQCPDSESIFGLLESYITLYDITGEAKWIEYAKASADLASSWCVAYDFKFPLKSQFAKRGIKTTGAVWASIQNKHAGPGICTLSGVSLFKLYRATGEKKYLDLFMEISHNITQFVSLDENPFRNTWCNTENGVFALEGQVGERINLSDWEGKENVGEFPGGSCWCEVTMLLNYVENPGVYVVKDKEQIYCFDHVSCRILQSDNNILLIELSNETEYDAIVSLFCESSCQQRKSLGAVPWGKYQKILVEKHGITKVYINK